MVNEDFERDWLEFWQSGEVQPALMAAIKEVFRKGWEAGHSQGWEDGLDAAGASA